MKIVYSKDFFNEKNSAEVPELEVQNIAFVGLLANIDKDIYDKGRLITAVFNVTVIAQDIIQVLAIGVLFMEEETDNKEALDYLLENLPEVGVSQFKNSVVRELLISQFFRHAIIFYKTIFC